MPVRVDSGPGTPAGGRGLAVAMAVVVAVMMATAGCGSDQSDDLPPPRSPGPAQSPTAPTLQLTAEEQQAVDEVRTIFDEFMHAYIDLATSGDPPDQDAILPVVRRLNHPLGGSVRDELVDNYLAARRLDGVLEWTFVGVVAVDLQPAHGDRDPDIALRYCVDAANWQTMDGVSGEVSDSDQVFAAGFQLGVVRAVYFDPYSTENLDPQWYVSSWEGEEALTC
jgi:hypothetical protein